MLGSIVVNARVSYTRYRQFKSDSSNQDITWVISSAGGSNGLLNRGSKVQVFHHPPCRTSSVGQSTCLTSKGSKVRALRPVPSECGGIGRHNRLKICRPQKRIGSTPIIPTKPRGRWCNGSTAGCGPVGQSSSLCFPTNGSNPAR